MSTINLALAGAVILGLLPTFSNACEDGAHAAVSKAIMAAEYETAAAEISSRFTQSNPALDQFPIQMKSVFSNGFETCEVVLERQFPPRAKEQIMLFENADGQHMFMYTFSSVLDGEEMILKFHLSSEFEAVFATLK